MALTHRLKKINCRRIKLIISVLISLYLTKHLWIIIEPIITHLAKGLSPNDDHRLIADLELKKGRFGNLFHGFYQLALSKSGYGDF